MKINYNIKLLTPFTTAQTGTIGKDIDVVVKRDVDGHSFISGKQIKGVLRAKVIELKKALGEEAEPFVERYFGKGGDINIPKLRFSNLKIKNEKKDYFKSRYSVKIDRKTRVAEDNTLFNYEFVKSGNQYEGEIEVRDYENEEDLKFLLASLLHVDRLGGLKSRGLGRVEITVNGKGIKSLDTVVKEVTKAKSNNDIKHLEKTQFEKYSFQMEFLEPVVLNGKAIKNQFEVRDSLQGSTVRGAIIQYGLNKGVDIDLLRDVAVADLGQYKDGKKIIKLASMFETKYKIQKGDRNGKIKIDKVISSMTEYKNDENEKPVKLERNSLSLLKAEGTEISIKIDEKTRTAEDRMIFGSEYIAGKRSGNNESNITFLGTAVLPEGLFETDKDYELLIGKFKSKGYGKVKIKFSKYDNRKMEIEKVEERIKNLNKVIKNLNEEIEEPKEREEEIKNGTMKLITFDLMSDMILPFNQVQNVGEQFKALINFGDKLELSKKKTFVNTDRLRGYNIVNNIRKADELIIKSGSVLTYYVDNEKLKEIIPELEILEEKGLGLRRNEGFGKIQVCNSARIEEHEKIID